MNQNGSFSQWSFAERLPLLRGIRENLLLTWGRENFFTFPAVIASQHTAHLHGHSKVHFLVKGGLHRPSRKPILPSPILEFERNHVVPCSSDRGPQRLLGGALLTDAEPIFSNTVDSPGEV